MILVMEMCKGNLESQIFDHPEVAPAKAMNPDVSRDIFRWAKEITAALVFFTKRGLSTGTLSLRTSWYEAELCVLC